MTKEPVNTADLNLVYAMEYYSTHHPRREVGPSQQTTETRRTSSESSSEPYKNRKHHRRRNLDRRNADQSKHEIMKQHEVLSELKRRIESSNDTTLDVNYYGRRGGGHDNGGTNVWIYLVISTCVILASIVTSSDAYSTHLLYRHVEQNQSMYWMSLSLCIIQLVLSLANAAYMIFGKRKNSVQRDNRRQNVITLVTILVAVILQSLINFILLSSNNYFAVVGLSVMINNMFYGCWISFGLLSVLFGNAIASYFYNQGIHDKGVEKQGTGRTQFLGRMAMLWTMHLLFTICVLSSTISIRSSPICRGMLKTTSSCENVSAAFILSIFNIPICMACLFNVFSFLRVKDAVLVTMHGASAGVSLVIQATTTGLVTTSGGLASNPGNLFISTWTNTLLSLFILLQCIDDYRLAISSPEGLEPADDRIFAKSDAYFSSVRRPMRARSTRTNDTPSTDVSDEEVVEVLNIQLGAPPNTDTRRQASPLALPAPPPAPVAQPAPRLEPPLPPTVIPDMTRKPPQPNNPINNRKVRSRRSALPHSYSIAPQPPAFREPPPAKPRRSRIEPETDSSSRKHKFKFMEPIEISEREERRLSQDPPLACSDSIQEVTYYHSSRDELRVSRESSDSKIEAIPISTHIHMNSTDPSGNNAKTNTSRRTESVYSKKSSKTPLSTSRQDRASISKGSTCTRSNKVMPHSKHANSNKSKSNTKEPSQSGFRKSPLPSHQSSKSPELNLRSATLPKQSSKKSNCSASIRCDHCEDNPRDASLSFRREQPETSTSSIALDDLDWDNGLTSGSENDIQRKSSSISASAKNIDDYISGQAITPDGLRKSITKRTQRQNSGNTNKTALSTKPSSGPSYRQSSSSNNKKLKASSSKENCHASAAVQLRAKSEASRTTQESMTSNVPSEHSPVTSHDDNSVVETKSPDSSFSSTFKHEDSAHLNDDSNHDEEGNCFLDFEYRPRATTQNFHANFTRSQVLSSFLRPIDDINMNNESSMMISDPTLDNSIKTTKKYDSMVKDSDIDKTVRESLQKSYNMMSFGKISVEGHGNLGDVNDIVAAALKAATESRGVGSS